MPLTPQQKQQRQAAIAGNKTALQTGGVPTDVRSITSTENPLPGTQGPVSNPTTTSAPFQVSSSPMVNLVQGVVDGKIDPTTRETATARAEGEFGKAALTQKDIFGNQTQQVVPGTDNPTFQQFSQQNDKLNAQDLAASKQAVDAANSSGAYDLNKFADSAKSSLSGIEASLNGGRNGVQSAGTPGVVKQYSDRINGDIQQASTNYNAAKAQRDAALAKAEQARANGQLDTAKFWEGQIASQEASMERERQNAESLSQNALSQSLEFSREARYAQQQGFTQGKEMLDFSINNGVNLSTSQTIDIAKKMGLKPEDVAAYNEEITRIQGTKGVDDATKQIAMEQAALNLNRAKTGRDSEKVRELDFLKDAYKRGASADEIAMIKEKFGITDYNDPLTAAKLAMANAQIRIEQYKADNLGKEPPYGTKEYWDMKKAELEVRAAQAELDEYSGGSSDGGLVWTPGNTGMRTDRNNNPIASKMYAPTVRLLEGAGLVKGVDFDAVGDSTAGVDSDSVGTVKFMTPEAGLRGAVAVLSGGQIGSWYANDKYGGAGRIRKMISEAGGGDASTAQKAQIAFNTLSQEQQIKIVADIYKHEGGKGKFTQAPRTGTKDSTDMDKILRTILASDKFTKAQQDAIRKSVEQDGMDGAKEWAYNNLSKKQQDDFDAIETTIGTYKYGESMLQDSALKVGPYKDLVESRKPWLDIKRDQKYVDLVSTVEQGQLAYRNSIFGAALTESELEYANKVFVNSADDIETIRTKLQNGARILQWINDKKLANKLGLEKPKLDTYINPLPAAGQIGGMFKNALDNKSTGMTDEDVFKKYQNVQAMPENISKFGYE